MTDPPAPAAPPTQRGTASVTPRSTWPTVLATLSIVFGAGGLVAYGCLGVAMTLLSSAFADTLRSIESQNPQMGVQAAQMDAFGEYMGVTLATQIAAAVLALMLLIVGIGLAGRRRWSARASDVWSILKLVYIVPAVYFGMKSGMAQFDAASVANAQAGAGSMPQGFFGIMRSVVWLGVAIHVVWLGAWPVFLLIWFRRPAIREEVAAWDEAATP